MRGGPAFARGTSLIDLMVGITIALLAILVVYRVLAASELLRRNAQSAGGAQQTGLFALSRITLDIANAGAGISASAKILGTCPATADIGTITRPIPVLITDGGSDDTPDGVVIRYGVGNGLAVAAPFAAAAAGGANFQVQSPLGFAPGDQVVAISQTGDCPRTTITAASAVGPGIVDLAHAAIATNLPDSAMLLNLGPANRVVTTRYDVVGGVLRTTDMQGGDAPNPLASNVVNVKLQYGIDTDGDGALDTWVTARDAGAFGAWTPAALLAAPPATLARIKAIRVGLIVRGEQFDPTVTGAFRWVLFDCPEADKSTCPGRLNGVIAATGKGGWHYRSYETVVPLRNQLWNPL
jgi:type IV pilus assembly protein PilW